MDLEHRCLKKIVRLALEEDRVDDDITTNSLADLDGPARAELRAKEAGVISGIEAFALTMREVDPELEVDVFLGDGCAVKAGDLILEVSGRESSILRGERTALNFMQRLSGIATLTQAFVEALTPSRAVLLDTRKTTPGMRYLEKNAVRHGGGRNHRLNLEDMAMVKDNHIAMAGGITPAVERVRAACPHKTIEVEVKTIAELKEALALGVELVMLDNFPLERTVEAVAVNGGRAKLEISGNVTLENIAAKAATGVDFISAGALTHSFRSLDLSLKIVRSK
ncbi:MAG: carboxylating nicotinate-nucleotide diphosphorylase [Acidobacteriota bacterium]|nr:carboxylating nicotinate-nucleotide diphosphorylase [Acidobacteriota bacterium]